MTDAERTLWQRLRRRQIHGLQFYRQKPLLNYIVDFYCPQAALVIELDGSQHLESEGKKGMPSATMRWPGWAYASSGSTIGTS